MSLISTCVTLAALLLFQINRGEAAAHTGMIKSAWEPICGISEELGQVAGEAWAAADTILENVHKFELAALRAAVYYAKNVASPEAKKAALLQNYYTNKQVSLINQYRSSALQSHLRAAQTSSYLKGRIDDYLRLLEQTTDSNNNCLLQTTSAETPAARHGTQLESAECALDIPNIAKKQAPRAYLTASGYGKIHEGADGGNTIQAASGTDKCRLLSTDNTNGFANSASITKDIKAMAGYLHIKGSGAAAQFETLENLAAGAPADTKPWKEALAARNGIVTTTEAAYNNETVEPSKLASLQHTIDKAMLHTETATPQQRKDEVAKILGEDTKAKLDAAANLISQEQIPQGTAELKTPTKLGDINNAAQLLALLYHYQIQALQTILDLKTQLDTATTKKDPNTAEDTCNKITAKIDCNAKPYCSYNETAAYGDKKCQFNETKASKNGVPVTQTQTVEPSTNPEKCKGKEEKDCKSPNCKWEGETCKDSSILVNKKFALSVVSAAFVALLF
uniref:Variant surface glycoprotein 1125.211 n=1 Tax=Trypanosoma brucei TaxID=5691 RepID=A0A1J0R5E9_9TRYP|nr:variant surface glycoprotein 1125.211 [Trypanosoma brucei]